MLRPNYIICWVLLLHTSAAWAEQRVLLEPLSAVEEADARSRNGYFLARETFIAKRHRLVKVDIELLEAEGEIVIPLFDGERIVARSNEIEINEIGGYLAWHGELVQDQVTLALVEEALAAQNIPTEAADMIFKTFTQVQVSVSFYERDNKTGANLNPVTGLLDAISPCKPNLYAKYGSDPNYVRGANASFSNLDKNKSYRLSMLGMGGPYHILYEVDSTRLTVPGNDVIVPGQPYESGLTPEQDRRNATLTEERNAIEQTIGENPHDVLYEERIERVRQSDAERMESVHQLQPAPGFHECETG